MAYSHEEIIRDERGKFVINVKLWMPGLFDRNEKPKYMVFVQFTEKGKRKPLTSDCSNMLTEAEIKTAKLNYWNKIKPV